MHIRLDQNRFGCADVRCRMHKSNSLIQEYYLGSIFSAASFRPKAKSLLARHVGFEQNKEHNNIPWVALSVALTQTIWTKDEGFP